MIANNNVIEGRTTRNVSRDQSGRSEWSREQVENSNAIDRFFPGAYSLVISVVILGASKTSPLKTDQFEDEDGGNKE